MSTEVFVPYKLNTAPAFPQIENSTGTPDTRLPVPNGNEFIKKLFDQGVYHFDRTEYMKSAHEALDNNRYALIMDAHRHPLRETIENYEAFVLVMGEWLSTQDNIIPNTWQDPNVMQQSYRIAHDQSVRLPSFLVLAGLTHPMEEVRQTAELGLNDLPAIDQNFVQTELQVMGAK